MVAIKQALLLISLVILVLALSTLLQRLVGPPVPFGGPGAQGGACTAVGGKPDATCTPGVVNPDVTQANIQQTICVSGWTKTIRPPVAVTNRIKAERMHAYGMDGVDPSTVELDHLVPLEAGGHPSALGQLWPQPYATDSGAHRKDLTENALRAAICEGRMPLTEGQHKIATDWIGLEQELRTAGLMPVGLSVGDGVVDADDAGEP